MRSIILLLILVMIGLNGKGQSVTASPDSVLSQCCLEVTTLTGVTTTVDWVFIQYITRDGTGTKLFVEYAPNFGGIQWETQIRIQDDFDDVIARSKFIVIPFTVGTTDYGINRNWIANIEENATTGGTWIYGRFGTPTKRKFSAVEDYETLKNLLLECRPRAIVIAENGLYTEGDTVRMGGFLIEPTKIRTEGYNWQMKDEASKVEFGLDYLTPGTLDTTVYWARRHGVLRQMVQLGRQYYYNTITDTISGKYSRVEHSWNSGNPFWRYQSFNPSATTEPTTTVLFGRDQTSITVKETATNPYYTHSLVITPTQSSIGNIESGSGDPGNGVQMGAYGFGMDEFLFLKTRNVDANTATVGQFLQLQSASTGEAEWATINLSGYLQISDTSAMLSPYIRTAGWGLIKSPYTLRVDSTLLATRTYTNRFLLRSDTSAMLGPYIDGFGTVTRIPIFTGSRTIGNSPILYNSTTKRTTWDSPGVIELPMGTDAQRPSPATMSDIWYNTTSNGLEWYNGTRWAKGLESTFNRGTATRVPFFDANGQVMDDAGITYTSGTGLNLAATTTHPSGQVNISGTSINSTGANTITSALGISTTLNATVANTKRYGIYVNPTFTGTSAEHAGIFIPAKTQYTGAGNAAIVLQTSSSNGIYITGTANRALIELIPTSSSTRSLSIVNTADNAYGSLLVSRVSSTLGIGTGLRFSVAQSGISDTQCGYEVGAVQASVGTNYKDDLVFRSNYSLGGTFSVERARLTGDGFLGVGTTSPTEMIHSADDIRVGDSLRIGTTPAHSSISGLLTRDANGWVGLSTLGSGLSYSGGVLSATGASTWLKTELEASRDVTINGGSSTDFTIQNSRVQFEGKFKVGSDSSFYHDPVSDYTYANGVIESPNMLSNTTATYSKRGAFISQNTTYGANQGSYFTLTNKSSNGWAGGFYINNFPGVGIGQNIETGWQVGRESGRERYGIYHYLTDPKTGISGNYIEIMQDTAYVPGGSVGFYRFGGKTGFQSKFLWFSSTGFSGADTVHFKFKNTNGAGLHNSRFFTVENYDTSLFVIRKNGTLEANKYGTGAKTAAALSKTQSNYIAGFATDGTALDLERKRDTTIIITDASYSFGTAVTTAQVLSRYNRVVIYMKCTSAATANNTVTLHVPDANLNQTEIIIHSIDDNGSFRNDINFTTNGAVNTVGGTITTYNLSAGQQLRIRVVNDSGWKYFFGF